MDTCKSMMPSTIYTMIEHAYDWDPDEAEDLENVFEEWEWDANKISKFGFVDPYFFKSWPDSFKEHNLSWINAKDLELGFCYAMCQGSAKCEELEELKNPKDVLEELMELRDDGFLRIPYGRISFRSPSGLLYDEHDKEFPCFFRKLEEMIIAKLGEAFFNSSCAWYLNRFKNDLDTSVIDDLIDVKEGYITGNEIVTPKGLFELIPIAAKAFLGTERELLEELDIS